MSERERWIVYPLLFLALGAALRDKFLQHVSTRQVECQRIVASEVICEDLKVIDSEKPARIVCHLLSQKLPGQTETDRYGVLILRDSENNELCGVTNNVLQVRRISCEQVDGQSLRIIDPENPQQPLALMAAASATTSDKKRKQIGSLLLFDSEGGQIFGLVNDQMRMRGIISQSLAIANPQDPSKILAVLGSDAVPASGGKKRKQIAVLEMNGKRLTLIDPEQDEPAQ